VYYTENELRSELNDRLRQLETGEMEKIDADKTLRRVREAPNRSRR